MKEIDTANLKGVFDFLPKEQLIRNRIIDTLKIEFEKYNYLPAETTILNNYNLLAWKYNDDAEILKEMYTLTDQKERDLGLRYDLTIPFCKIIANQKEKRLPFKRYEIGKVFRNGPVKVGRNREFTQCDVDVVGIDGRFIEVEQMQLVIDVFNKLGIDIEIRYNNRLLMNGLLKEYGIEESSFASVIGVIDKVNKLTKEELAKEFSDLGIKNSDGLYSLFSKSINEYNEIYSNTSNESIREGLSQINEIENYIDLLGIRSNVVFTPSLARGLGIYTGIVFEFFDKEERMTCSLGGGGRYDNIITDFIDDGNKYPAIGLSFGLEPIYTILKQDIMESLKPCCYIVPLDTEIDCLTLARKIRQNGISVCVEMNKRKLKRCFEYAEKENYRYIVIVGSNEVANNKYSVKDLLTKEQYEFNLSELIIYIKGE